MVGKVRKFWRDTNQELMLREACKCAGLLDGEGGVERNVQDRRKNIWREARELCWGSRGELNDRVLISTRTSPSGG